VRAVRQGVGINEVQNFGKYRVSGAGARGWLERVMAGRIPPPGRVALSPMLSEKGRIIGDFTISGLRRGIRGGLSPDRVLRRAGLSHALVRAAGRGRRAHRERERPADRVPDRGAARARCSGACTDEDLSEMRFLDLRRMGLGPFNCLVQRVSYTGDLGYEIYCDAMEQRALWDVLWQAGQPHGITPFGMRAMMSLRLDRFFGSWGREYSPDYTCAETGLDRFLSFAPGRAYIGREAAEAERATPPARRLAAFIVEADDADVQGYEPVWIDGAVQGFCTSGGYSHHARCSVALALVPRERAVEGLEAEIEILGNRLPARLITAPLFEPAA
jgi:dimethylglycine dehydrogenase